LTTALLRELTKNSKPGIIQPWTELSVRLRKPTEVMDEWQADTQSGLIAFLAISVPLLLVISFIPCLYHVYLKTFGKKN